MAQKQPIPCPDLPTALKVFLDVLNSYWLQKLVELLRPSKTLGRSKKPWDLGDLWQPVSDWYYQAEVKGGFRIDWGGRLM